MDQSDTSIREALDRTAARLTKRFSQLPIPVGRITNELGVQIERKNLEGRGSSYLMLPHFDGEAPRVLLSTKSRQGPHNGVTSADRFKVAHELGHYVVFSLFGITPRGESEYWKHEDICDGFARLLLTPERLCRESSLTGARGITDVDLLSKRARIPWMQAATRITELAQDRVFFVLDVENSRLKVSKSSLANKREIKRILHSKTQFADLVLRTTERAPCEAKLRAADLVRAGFTTFNGTSNYCVQVRFAWVKEQPQFQVGILTA
ncbi:ImmA/IrrE family metallo-endopeptidase [Bradyrhizobium stylosanthis]|uniref:IrrE N-terminal-like domain-containing protein n=1 Tax=Bradyrhizobium stylosanthis TaxID=1803665 RepID=A0A560EDP1_9BRAD|nr:ImmA/IrrE family metallo-endopeptidase [Bradyrhizobium stylosanthis]TWB07385.1 hypothetical protein FBZ96_1011207 [Bradyrhizobium stylosanthis]